jgi:hypothetical protein
VENIWNHRKEMDLEPDETAVLREIVREAKGIKPAYGNSAVTCGQCGMVGQNCTCGSVMVLAPNITPQYSVSRAGGSLYSRSYARIWESLLQIYYYDTMGGVSGYH